MDINIFLIAVFHQSLCNGHFSEGNLSPPPQYEQNTVQHLIGHPLLNEILFGDIAKCKVQVTDDISMK